MSAATHVGRGLVDDSGQIGSSPIASYRITRSDGKVNTAPATARTITLTGLAANTNVSVSVAAVAENGQVGAASSVPIYGTSTTVTAPARVRKGQPSP